MSSKKLTDIDIVRVLNCCYDKDEIILSFYEDNKLKVDLTVQDIIDLINRLNAELDESREKNAGLALALLHEVVNQDEQLRNEITKVAKSEAYKEFSEACKACFPSLSKVFDIILKEMGCE